MFKTKAEKKAFKQGMIYQYNKDYPQYNYAAAVERTIYNKDGSIYHKHYSPPSFFKTKKEMDAFISESNKNFESDNSFVMRSVKYKNVNQTYPNLRTYRYAKGSKIKSTRVKGKMFYEKLPFINKKLN